MLEEKIPVESAIVKAIIRLGRATEKLDHVLKQDWFDDLSKHNPYWHSEHEPECEKLDETRRRLQTISDTLWDVWAVLKGAEDDGY